jgi:trans-aconitate methyltransferase
VTTRNNQWRLYRDLSWTWPIISPPEDYIEESQRIKRLIRKHTKIPVKTVLNLGCGGGHVDWVLKKYFAITGIDISPNMLRNARKLNPEVIYRKGDMRTVRLKKKFDAVVLHDSVNYMLTRSDLKKVFQTAYVHLKPGGVLWTCVEEYGKIRQNRIKSSTSKKKDIEITFIENNYDPNPQDTTYESTFIYLVRKNRKLSIYTDRHLCGIFKLQTWFSVIRETGFRIKRQRFIHSTIPKTRDMPELICLKPE